ncbi:thioredoxin family protein [Paenibacillus chitinolyticus]|uniref:thioredoxin family protein n=1 Tax=Paenibacillus chitinolyticus TaxID=79263 RepID=UPI0026E4BCFA|nr:thioredoxin family protein [Paenibacillus chitinolyticus]GKS09710.1 hypothetical protein YDYSY3_07100 [Paenibacillus chitinolyticus]
MSLTTVNDATYLDHISDGGVTVIDFTAVWCPPCKTLLPILEELSNEYAGKVNILKVDCDDSPEAASAFGVMSMPTVLVLHRGEPVEKLVGLRPKSVYQSVLSRYIG